MQTRAICLKSRPVGMPKDSDFEVVSQDLADPGDGEIQVANVCMSVDPYMRGRMVDRKSYVPPFQIGEVLTGGCIGEVVKSSHADFAEGDYVSSSHGWREAYTAPTDGIEKLGNLVAEPSLYLGPNGMPGMTAYVGLLAVGALKDGETVFVSGAAGAVGSIVGQIAKLKGCRVVGVAGSDEKCQILTKELGFDLAVNYKESDFRAAFKAATPDRIDVYFDNTGGDILGSALFRMNTHGRIACCGAVSQYDTSTPAAGPRGVPGLLVNNRVRMEGFLLFDYADRYAEARAGLAGWIQSGQLVPRATEFKGLEQAPTAFIELLAGGTVGTTIVRVAE